MTIVHVTTMSPIAQMVGNNRIVTGNGIVHPVGAADRPPAEELRIRRQIVEKALTALTSPAPFFV